MVCVCSFVIGDEGREKIQGRRRLRETETTLCSPALYHWSVHTKLSPSSAHSGVLSRFLLAYLAWFTELLIATDFDFDPHWEYFRVLILFCWDRDSYNPSGGWTYSWGCLRYSCLRLPNAEISRPDGLLFINCIIWSMFSFFFLRLTTCVMRGLMVLFRLLRSLLPFISFPFFRLYIVFLYLTSCHWVDHTTIHNLN